jgi:tellurite resistance protein
LKNDEANLKDTERPYEWTMFSNVIAENRGIFLLKFLEYLCADVKTVKTELEDLTNTVTNISQATGEITDENKASVEQEIKNLEQIIDQLETLGSLTTQQEGLMLNLGIQVLRAENLKEDLEKKIKDYEAAAKSMADLAAWINALDAIM